MSPAVPPLPVGEAARAAAVRAVAHAAGIATASAWVMLVLGAASLAVSLTAPLSASFAISVAVLFHGWLERRLARHLVACDIRAPRKLALNQVALGIEIAAYAVWQAHVLGPEQIDLVVRRPIVARFLSAMDLALLEEVLRLLPAAVRVLYLVVGGAALVGCIATAAYYGSRVRCVRLSQSGVPPLPSPSVPS
mgnify:CR=1 FL=1